jgi:hypothetical protein
MPVRTAAGDRGQHQVGPGRFRLPGQQEHRQKHRSPHLVDGPDEYGHQPYPVWPIRGLSQPAVPGATV